jgi:predicted negative regulator of RcsB-dependent stress response
VADDKQSQSPAPLPELPAFPGQEQDALFKAQMTVANLFYGYWRHALVLIVAVLVGVFAWGTWQNHVRDSQREIHAEVAKISRTLQAGLEKNADDPEMIKAQAAEGARRLVAVADQGDGAGSTYALIRAAQAWRVADDDAQLLATWERAHARGAKGTLGWAAASGLAAARFDQGDVDGAIQVLTTWAGKATDYEAQRALFESARYQELAGRKDAAIAAFESFSTTFPESALKSDAAAALDRLRSQG